MTKVVLFTTPSCSWCRRAKKYLRENRVPFKEINVEKDQRAARDLVKETGQMDVPVVKIGNKWIVGFDKSAIERELARKGA